MIYETNFLELKSILKLNKNSSNDKINQYFKPKFFY